MFISLVWMAGSTFAQSLERFSFAEPHLGTIVELTLYAPEETVANEAARTAFARVKELDLIFSDYNPASEIMRLCENAGRGVATKVSRELFQLLTRSLAVSEQTDGAFDVTIGPLVKLWRRARKSKMLPAAAEIAAARQAVGWKLVSLNEVDQTVELRRTGMQLDFGGIAKGYIAQEVNRVLREKGLKQTLVAISGDIVAGESPPGTDGWKVAVAALKGVKNAPGRLLLLKNCAVSTSGDEYQFVEIGGERYSHIVDPGTGLGLRGRGSVTVIAADGTTADAWDTAISVIGPRRGLALTESNHNFDVLVVLAANDGVKVYESPGFQRHVVK